MSLNEKICVLNEDDMEILENVVIPNTKYNVEVLNCFFEENILILKEDSIEFSFNFSTSHFEYRNPISAYTFINTLDGCLNNEFREDIKNDIVSISIKKDFTNPDNLYSSVSITSTDTDLDEFIDRMVFISIVFNISIEKLNEIVEESALSARILCFADTFI